MAWRDKNMVGNGPLFLCRRCCATLAVGDLVYLLQSLQSLVCLIEALFAMALIERSGKKKM
jgi:hypothetical protein